MEMAELSPMQLGSSDTLDDKQLKGFKLKLQEITNIVTVLWDLYRHYLLY